MNKLKLQTVINNVTPSQEEAEEAVRTLIKWAGDNPYRKGLKDTPSRVVRSYKELFSGYSMRLDEGITKLFDNENNYDDIIMLKDIRIESVCEHHMVPIIGKVTIGYIPDKKIIGLSKLARIADYHAKRFQLQERLVVEIANTLNNVIKPLGVGIVMESSHQCMTTRGVHKPGAKMRTAYMLGSFKDNNIRREFLLEASSNSSSQNYE